MLYRLNERFGASWFGWLVPVFVGVVALILALQAQLGPPGGPRAVRGGERGAIPPLEQLPARPGTLDDVALSQLPADAARRRNAAVPIAPGHPLPAPPFKFAGSAIDRARAIDCLALAAMAEGGGSDPGQRAVIQVILNRARHPAFSRTICGAVFTGSQRRTGCQFTFTCDGALQRRYSDSAWSAARRRAEQALDGRVYAPVGLATHYHTDWVYPWWSPELEKIAQVETHLFFRWPGYWGSRQAMTARYDGGEPRIAALADLPSHAGPEDEAEGLAEAGLLDGDAPGEVVVRHADGRAFFVLVDARAPADQALSLARQLCPGDQANCRVMGWTSRGAIPASYPVPLASREQLSFSYVREATGEIVFYDCKHFPDTPRDKCIPPPRRV